MGEHSVASLRPDALVARPVRLDPAFDDPERIPDMLRAGAPYPLLAVADRMPEAPHYDPWFRAFWAVPGRSWLDGAEQLLHDPRLIEAAKQSFGARIIRPQVAAINLSGPMASGKAHVDLPFFRGTPARDYPVPLLMCMRSSGLFQRWAIPIASALVWFYVGRGGAFEYWPDGPAGPAAREATPLWNVGLVSDNDYMFHRVARIGSPDEDLPPRSLSRSARLHYRNDGDWEIVDRDAVAARYRFDQVRISILWKAQALADEVAADELDDHSADLDPEQIVSIFMDDLQRRGLSLQEPEDPRTDATWLAALDRAYPAGGPVV